jgi:hypothetical protein
VQFRFLGDMEFFRQRSRGENLGPVDLRLVLTGEGTIGDAFVAVQPKPPLVTSP